MAFNYSGDPTSSTRDEVRFLIGDTDSTDAQLQDLEVDYLLSKYTTAAKAALAACLALASRYARLCDKAVGDLRISYSQRQKQYLDLARELGRRTPIRPWAGGLSSAGKDAANDDTDRIVPAFQRDLDTNTST